MTPKKCQQPLEIPQVSLRNIVFTSAFLERKGAREMVDKVR